MDTSQVCQLFQIMWHYPLGAHHPTAVLFPPGWLPVVHRCPREPRQTPIHHCSWTADLFGTVTFTGIYCKSNFSTYSHWLLSMLSMLPDSIMKSCVSARLLHSAAVYLTRLWAGVCPCMYGSSTHAAYTIWSSIATWPMDLADNLLTRRGGCPPALLASFCRESCGQFFFRWGLPHNQQVTLGRALSEFVLAGWFLLPVCPIGSWPWHHYYEKFVTHYAHNLYCFTCS